MIVSYNLKCKLTTWYDKASRANHSVLALFIIGKVILNIFGKKLQHLHAVSIIISMVCQAKPFQKDIFLPEQL